MGKRQKRQALAEDAKFITKTTQAWMDRVGAVQSSMKRFVVKTVNENGYPRHDGTLRINKEGMVTYNGKPEYAPTIEETEAIAEEAKTVKYPESIPATKAGFQLLVEAEKNVGDFIAFFSLNGDEVVYVEQRIEKDDGKKDVLPWTFWNDGVWRMMEPDGLLPLWGLARCTGQDQGWQQRSPLEDGRTEAIVGGRRSCRGYDTRGSQGRAGPSPVCPSWMARWRRAPERRRLVEDHRIKESPRCPRLR